MGQNIINIPVVWDDELITKMIEKGAIEEVRQTIVRRAEKELGFDTYWGGSRQLEDLMKECAREVVQENKDKILEEVIRRGHKSLIGSKEFKQAKKDMEAWMNGVAVEEKETEVR